MQAAKDIERLREIVTAEFPPVNKQLLLIWKAESVTPILTKAIDEWIEVIDKKRPMIDIGTYHEAIALTGDHATAIKADGGTVGDVRSYFENVDTSNLPPSAAVYLREQLLTDPKLKDFDPENETFKLLKSAIDGINKKHTIVKTEEFIDLPEEQMQQRAVRKVEPPVVELQVEKPVIVAAPVNLDEEEPEAEIDERAIVEEQIADYQAAVKYLTGTDKETMETAIADLKIALKYLPEKKEQGGKIGLTKDDLKEYGKVDICEEKDGKFHVKITEGFSTNFDKTFELMKKINDAVGHKYSIVDKCVTNDNLFDYVLSPSKKAMGGIFKLSSAKRPKSALMRDRKYTSQQEWEVDYPRKKRRKFYKEDGGEVEGEEEKIGLDLPDYKRVYLMFDYLKKTYPDYTDAKMSGDPEYDDSERGNENYNDVFFEMIDDLRETYLTEEEESWANTLVEQYMAGDTSVAQVGVKSDFFPTGEATAFYRDGKFVGLKYVIEQGDLDVKKRTKYTVWFFDLPENKTLEEFLAEAKAGKHKGVGTSVTGNWDKVQKEIKTAIGNLKSGGKLKRNLSRDRQFVSHQEWEMNYNRKVNAKHYKADGGAFDTDLLFKGGTMADLKRKLGLGTAVKLVNWQGKTDPAANPNIGLTRYVVKAQSNSVAFNADKNAKSGSWWEFPPASLVEITPTGFKVYEPARRPLNAEEQAIMDKQPVDAEQQQIDVMTDGSVMYYRRKDYFENAGYGYLYNHNWEKGKLYSNGVVLDKSIKGNLALEYEFVDARNDGGGLGKNSLGNGPYVMVNFSSVPVNYGFFYKKANEKSPISYVKVSSTSANDVMGVEWDFKYTDQVEFLKSIADRLEIQYETGGEISEKTTEGTPGYQATIYYKDEPDDLKTDYLFSEGQSSEDDDSIFFYVENEREMKSLMDRENGEDFVVVSYVPTMLFKKGGRLKSAINRDRKYTSQQEWEKDYNRQGKRKFYKADGGSAGEIFFDLSNEDIAALNDPENASIEYDNHWVIAKIKEEYEAIRDGLYMEVFGNLEDLKFRRNQKYYEYDSELSEKNQQETFVNTEGEEREYRKGGRLKSAINRDRKYTSQQEWEKDYNRQGRRKFYKAEGGELEDKLLLGIGTVINIPSFGLDRNVRMTLREVVPLTARDIAAGLGKRSYKFSSSKGTQYYPEAELEKKLNSNHIEIIKRMAEGGELTAEEIPVLSESATWEDVKKYLLWLKDSEYAYHIDDNPEDVVTFTELVAAVLKANSDILWKHASDKQGTNLWDVYHPLLDEEEENGFMVMNQTDGIHASPEIYKTRAEAQAFVKNFPKRFKLMGYYLTARQERIKPEDVVLEIVPVGKHIWQMPRDKFVNDVVLETDAFKSYPSSITDNLKIVSVYQSPIGGTNEFNITRPTATKAKHYAKLVHEWVVQQALNDGENIPAEVMKDYPKMVKTEHVDVVEPISPFKEYFDENGNEVKGYISTWNGGAGKYEGLPLVYGVTASLAPNSFMIVAGILKDGKLVSTSEAHDDWFGDEDTALRAAYEIATNEYAVFKKGGRLKSAINRDRKYTSQQEWEKRYGRAGKRKFYKQEGGNLDSRKIESFDITVTLNSEAEADVLKFDLEHLGVGYGNLIVTGNTLQISNAHSDEGIDEDFEKIIKFLDDKDLKYESSKEEYKAGGKVKGDPNDPYSFVIKEGDKAYINDKKDPLYLTEGKVTEITDVKGDPHAWFEITHSTNPKWKKGEDEHVRVKHLTKMRDLIGIEFPGVKFEVPYFVTVENGFEDTSWHNDETASFSNIKEGIKLWVYPTSKKDRDEDIKQYVIQPCDAEGMSMGVDLLLTDDEREAGNFFIEYISIPKFKVKYEITEPGVDIDKGSLVVRAKSAADAEKKTISIVEEQHGSNAIVSVKSVLKTLETGGSFSKFLSKATDIAHKGVAGAKKGYERANKYAHDKVREKKRDIAWEVLQETRGIVDKKKDSILLNEASNLVDKNYKGGGEVKTKKRGRPATPHILPATNFDVRISRKLANELLDKDDELISSDGCEIYCKELGTKPGVWQQCLATDLINHKLPTKYKTFEVWCTGKLSKEECLNKLKLFIIANNLN